jgi:sterol desaturase/sphingolipid hydroxylase (fatty acid hydroxylase superfamily)
MQSSSIQASSVFNELLSFVVSLGETLIKQGKVTLILIVLFTLLSLISVCNKGPAWWRKRELVTDFCYWFFIPLMARFLRVGLLIVGAAMFFGITTAEGLIEFYQDGHGPLSRLPLLVQAAIFLIGSDFIMYWLHRTFHGPAMWKYHAIHHSSEELEWLSAARFHPINIFLGSVMADIALLLAGISPNVLVFLGPFTIVHSALVHANVNWTFGPFKYVLASPIFHRWHHTMPERGGERNFAGTFPVWDLIFGTFYMPKNEIPSGYGIEDKDFPRTFGEQMAYPYKQKPEEFPVRSPI